MPTEVELARMEGREYEAAETFLRRIAEEGVPRERQEARRVSRAGGRAAKSRPRVERGERRRR